MFEGEAFIVRDQAFQLQEPTLRDCLSSGGQHCRTRSTLSMMVLYLGLAAGGWMCGFDASNSEETAVDATMEAERGLDGRRILTIEWDTLFIVGGTVSDTIFGVPRLMASDRELVYVYDYSTARVTAIDSAGNIRWHFGGAGQGPAELANPMNLFAPGDGRLLILDAGAARLTTLNADGQLVGSEPLDGRILARYWELPGRRMALAGAITDPFWLAFDSSLDVIDSGAFPIVGMADLHPQWSRSTQIAAAGNHPWWATAFVFGDLFVSYHDTEFRCSARVLGTLPFPEAPAGARPWIFAAAATDSSYLFVTRFEGAPRLMDEYRAADCGYIGSYELPSPAPALAHNDGVTFIVVDDPAPAVLALRPMGAAASGD